MKFPLASTVPASSRLTIPHWVLALGCVLGWLLFPQTIFAQTTPSPSIAGQVTDEASNPLANIQVQAYQAIGNPALEIPHFVLVANTQTGNDGNYQLAVPAAGLYRLRFVDGAAPPRYQPEYYDNALQEWSAQLLFLNPGDALTGINAQLVLGGNITGRVTDFAGNPPSTPVQITAWTLIDDGFGNRTAQALGESMASAEGSYTLTVAFSGSVRLQFSDAQNRLLAEYYENVPALLYEDNLAAAKEVSVTIGATTPGIDVQMDYNARVLGRVTDRQGNPIANMQVLAYQLHPNLIGTPNYLTTIAGPLTAADGSYDFSIPRPGFGYAQDAYRICFQAAFGAALFAPTCYGGDAAETATPLALDLNQTRSNVDVQMARYGRIVGKVSDPDGKPIAPVEVTAYASPEMNGFFPAQLDASGVYTIDGLLPGNYKVVASGEFAGYETKWYDNAVDEASATLLPVALDQVAPINFVLALIPAHITIVLDNMPDSRQNIRFAGDLSAFKLDDIQPDDGDRYTNSAQFTVKPGAYRITELLPTDRVVTKIQCQGGSLDWNGVDPEATITVQSHDNTICTFTTERLVKILTRTYLDRNGNGVRNGSREPWQPNLEVLVLDSNGNRVTSKPTNSEGMADFTDLRPGSYKVCEIVPSDLRNTQPGTLDEHRWPCYQLSLNPGQAASVRFGNAPNTTPVPRDLATTPAEDSIIITDEPDVSNDEAGYPEVGPPPQQIFLPLISG